MIQGTDFNRNLFLETRQSKKSGASNTPRLIGTTGELSTTFDFNGQKITESCGVTFQNKHFIFGHAEKKRQILELNDCGLISIGSLKFDSKQSACSSTDQVILLCFNTESANDYKRCRQASSPTGQWSELALSKFDHRFTSIATSPGTSF